MLKGNRKRALPSMSDIAEMVNQTVRKSGKIPYQQIASTATTVSNVMKTSKGRDKICSYLQYWADFYYNCVKHSNIDEVNKAFKDNQFVAARLALRIKQSMSQGRKIFKFLKFLDEMKNIHQFLNRTKKPLLLKVLITLSHFSSIFYYVLDNTLWAISIGILSEFFDDEEYKVWKSRKNWFSLARNILTFIINMLRVQSSKQKEKIYIGDLESCRSKIIQTDDDTFDIVKLLIRKRRKRRFQILECFHSVLRLIMLNKGDYMHPIFVSFCGLVSANISLFKALQEKQKVIHLEENWDKTIPQGPKLTHHRSMSRTSLADIQE